MLLTATFKRRLEFVNEEVAELVSDSEPAARWCLEILETLHSEAVTVHASLQEMLANCQEARAFVRQFNPLLAATDKVLATIRECLAMRAGTEDAAFGASFDPIKARLQALSQEMQPTRNLLVEALTVASTAPLPFEDASLAAALQEIEQGEDINDLLSRLGKGEAISTEV